MTVAAIQTNLQSIIAVDMPRFIYSISLLASSSSAQGEDVFFGLAVIRFEYNVELCN